VALYNAIASGTVDRSKYQVLCANCQWIKKAEKREVVGGRVYAREVPTERRRGPGKGSHPNTKAIGGWWPNATPEQRAEVIAKRVATRAARGV
jgi:hypothetical protein